MNNDGRVGCKATSSVVGIAKAHRASGHLDMKHRPRLSAFVEGHRADAGQSTADTPSAKHVPALRRARVPALPDADQVPSIPRGKVDQAGVDTVDQQLAPAGQAFMAVDDREKKLHAVRLVPPADGRCVSAGTGALLRVVLVVTDCPS